MFKNRLTRLTDGNIWGVWNPELADELTTRLENLSEGLKVGRSQGRCDPQTADKIFAKFGKSVYSRSYKEISIKGLFLANSQRAITLIPLISIFSKRLERLRAFCLVFVKLAFGFHQFQSLGQSLVRPLKAGPSVRLGLV